MYHPGEIKTPGLELMLILIRLIIFAAVVFIVSGVGMLAHIPPVITGTAAGIAAFALLLGGLYEVVDFRCPHCGTVTRVIKNFGSFRCPACGQASYIENGRAVPTEADRNQFLNL
ncbi:hypothetical protein [Desulfotomaculum copahuensis]|uniref:Uncharacterized protein n=1 Tax=Desulfotomaculum copahuensis TaxID=1838280 RepID=A0A1B7LFW5_9FIRM|nr:hypothetical protein [Desulfotomaculum copahuensis]OAT83590.1 hypothetical protein A6M21_07850 [Desulfotomaculum copahuensis]